jgi:hypothetical protein
MIGVGEWGLRTWLSLDMRLAVVSSSLAVPQLGLLSELARERVMGKKVDFDSPYMCLLIWV